MLSAYITFFAKLSISFRKKFVRTLSRLHVEHHQEDFLKFSGQLDKILVKLYIFTDFFMSNSSTFTNKLKIKHTNCVNMSHTSYFLVHF